MKRSIITLVFILTLFPVAVSASTSKSTVNYSVTDVYAGLLSSGTLPSTDVVTVKNVMDSTTGKAGITPQQQNGFGYWVDTGDYKIMGTESHTFYLHANKPTKLWLGASGGTVDYHGTFND